MILYDPTVNMRFQDYGIGIPIAPDRAKRVLEFLEKDYYPGTRGTTFPYPGPVFSIAEALAYLETAENTIITREDLERVHSREFVDSLYDETSKKKLETALLTTFELFDTQGRLNRYKPETAKKPLSSLFRTILAQVGGTWLACRLALAQGPGFCYYLGGGMHHARYDSGSGFCLVNDIAVAAHKILAETAHGKVCSTHSEKPTPPPVRLIWIIDLDVHKGDGTAELIRFARRRGELYDPQAAVPETASVSDRLRQSGEGSPPDSNGGRKPCILTLSIHMAKGWPLDEESLAAAEEDRAPLAPSDVDIGINSGEEGEYTSRLADGIKELERLSAVFSPDAEKPDLILVVDGADPYEHDGLPSSSLLKLSLEQCLLRDNYVYRYVMNRGIPSAWIQSGGYGNRAWEPPAYFLQGIR